MSADPPPQLISPPACVGTDGFGQHYPLTLLLACVSWIFSLWPYSRHWFVYSNDGPEHVYSGLLLWKQDVLMTAPDTLEVHQPLLGFIVYLPPFVLPPSTPWFWAGWFQQVCMIGLLAAGLVAMAWQWRDRSVIPLLLVPAAVNGYITFAGFYNYMGAIGIGLFALSRVWRQLPEQPLQLLLVAALLTFCTASHPYAAMLIALGLFLRYLAGFLTAEVTARRAFVHLMVAGSGLLAYTALVALMPSAVPVESAGAVEWRRLASPADQLMQGLTGGPLWRSLPPLVLVFAGATLPWWPGRRPEGPELASKLYASALFALWLVMPHSLPGWQSIGERPTVLLLVISAGALACRWPHMMQRVPLGVLIGAWTVSAVAWSSLLQSDARRNCSEVIEWLEERPAQSQPAAGTAMLLLGQYCTPPPDASRTSYFLGFTPEIHFSAFANAAERRPHRGFHGNHGIHTFTLRDYVAATAVAFTPLQVHQAYDELAALLQQNVDAETRRTAFLELAHMMASFEINYLADVPSSLTEQLRTVGFSPESSTHDIQALRFTGCPVNLRIPSPPGRRMGERSMVIGGWEIHTLSDPGLSVLMPLGESGRLMLPCSESWFAVAIPDADAGRLHCAGADEHGVIRMASAPPGTRRTMECRLVPPT
jgi:hypothetical protein